MTSYTLLPFSFHLCHRAKPPWNTPLPLLPPKPSPSSFTPSPTSPISHNPPPPLATTFPFSQLRVSFPYQLGKNQYDSQNGQSRVALAALGILAVTLLVAQPSSALEGEGSRSIVEEVVALASQEPKNALSLPTWTIHVASVVEWIVAMALVWQYGDTPGNASWKGLSWGMVPLLGGAMCACTWHFFYNAESLEVLVALQGLLTVIGNFTMWISAFRIYQSTQGGSKAS